MTSATEKIVETPGPEATRAVGRALGERLRPGDVVALVGTLGAGKTVFAKGVALGVGVDPSDVVTSPTFVLIGEYEGRCPLYHVDAYRMTRPADFEALGADEILFGDGVCLIEWADRVALLLPAERLDVNFAVSGEGTRRLTFRGAGEGWQGRMPAIAAALDDVLRAS